MPSRIHHNLFRRGADITAILDACYAPNPDHTAWATDVIDAYRAAMDAELRIGAIAVSHDPTCTRANLLLALDPTGNDGQDWLDKMIVWGPGVFRHYFYPATMVTSHAILGAVERAPTSHVNPPDLQERLSSMRAELAVDDMFAIVVHPRPEHALVFFATLPRGSQVSREDRRRLVQIGLHAESAFRLRLGSHPVRAILDANGKVIERAPNASFPSDANWQESTRDVERARSTRDLDPWTALVEGEVSVVPRLEGSRRVYDLVENAHASKPFRMLTKREVDVLSVSSSGTPAKLCAYALGLSEASVSKALASAAAKIGTASRLELLRVAALLARHPRVSADDALLTDAEAEVLSLVSEGLSNAEIAKQRGRSIRTIANQVASLLQKTGATSRRALVTGSVD